MQIIDNIEAVRNVVRDARSSGGSIGLVPTMGALHKGHISLAAKAREDCDLVVMSVFVNPLQFGLDEDLGRYPRPFEQDVEMARECGVDVLFAPSVEEMYPGGPVLTKVSVAELSVPLEGAHRPGHFDGVTTVVAKLFNIAGECTAYFGEKDWQQLVVVRQMVSDLAFPVTLVACLIVREPDGLAMSSRNTYLDADERIAALALSRALEVGREAIASGSRNPSQVSALMTNVMIAEPLVEPHYAAVVSADLQWPEKIVGDVRLLVAAQVGPCRLIDNIGMHIDRAAGRGPRHNEVKLCW